MCTCVCCVCPCLPGESRRWTFPGIASRARARRRSRLHFLQREYKDRIAFVTGGRASATYIHTSMAWSIRSPPPSQKPVLRSVCAFPCTWAGTPSATAHCVCPINPHRMRNVSERCCTLNRHRTNLTIRLVERGLSGCHFLYGRVHTSLCSCAG